MIIKQVTQVGNPIIRKKSKTVTDIKTKETQMIIQNLKDSISYLNLVGMVAPQIGINKKIFISKISKTKFRSPDEVDGLRVFVNPKVVFKSKKLISGYEGCGSVAESGLFASIPRYKNVRVEAFDENGEKFILEATGL